MAGNGRNSQEREKVGSIMNIGERILRLCHFIFCLLLLLSKQSPRRKERGTSLKLQVQESKRREKKKRYRGEKKGRPTVEQPKPSVPFVPSNSPLASLQYLPMWPYHPLVLH